VAGRYFGYGSLVNPDARMADRDFQPAILSGWRRSWSLSGLYQDKGPRICGLTIEPADGSEIEGVVATRASSDWSDLDERERRYNRTPLQPDRLHGVAPGETSVYISKPEHLQPATPDNQFLQSYCDCVMQGYLRVFGEAGMNRFIATTAHWTPGAMRLDRGDPMYPRAVQLTSKETTLIDAAYRSLGLLG